MIGDRQLAKMDFVGIGLSVACAALLSIGSGPSECHSIGGA